MLPAHMFGDSPTLVMSAQHPLSDHQYFNTTHYAPVQAKPNGLPSPPETVNESVRPSLPPTPSEGSIAGSKRGRDDDDAEQDHGDGTVFQLQSVPPAVPRGEPIYGPGMTLVYPDDPRGSYATDATNQSGASIEDIAQANGPRRPILAARKSQRLDASAPRPEDMVVQATPRAPGTEPLIDEATRLLGVSWTRMDASETTQISQRAYTRWITRHYPSLTNVEVWFENSAIPGYLGKALNAASGTDEFYLWSYDLHQAILVTRNPADLIIKLSQPHMSLSQATEKISADVEPVVEAAAANAAIVRYDQWLEQMPGPSTPPGMRVDEPAGGMDLD